MVFQWTPRNLGSPNGAFNTEYEFTLKELWDTGIAPEAGFESSQPLYQVTLRPTTLLMGPAEPQLIPGKRYAWRVRAVSTSPTGEQADSYRNNGYSEIYSFTYQDNCKPPVGINSSISSDRATINWMADAISGGTPAGGYTVQYREKRLNDNKWYSARTLNTRAMLYDLKPGKTYEYRVGATCVVGDFGYGLDMATYSDILTLEMAGKGDTSTVNCGMISPEIAITNRTPIKSLNAGELFTAGKFPVKLTRVSGGGSFSGDGYVTITMLGYANIKVRFSNIQVNTDRQLFAGVVETSYNPKEEQLSDVNTIYNDIKQLVQEITDLLKKRTGYLDAYSGTAKDKKEAEDRNKEEDKAYEALLKSPNLSESEKTELKAEQASKKEGYYGLAGDKDCQGNEIVPKKGPNVDFEQYRDVDCFKKKIAEATKLKEYAEKASAAEAKKAGALGYQQDLATIYTGPAQKTTDELTAFLSPMGAPVYLKRADVVTYSCNNTTGVLAGFTLSDGTVYKFSPADSSYKTADGASYASGKIPAKGKIEVLLLKKLDCKAELYSVWIDYPNLKREIPAIQGAQLKESITLKCIDTYFDEHGTEFISTLQKIYSIYSYYEQCSEEQWKPYEDNGIVPYCFWRNAGTAESSYYYLTDRPYTSGVIDGAYGQVKGLYDIHKNFEKLIDAYGVGLLECDNLLDDYQSYERLQERIKQLEKEDGFWAAIKNSVNRYVARNKADKILACLASEKVRDDSEETITKLYEVVSNSEKLATASASIAKRLEAYLKQITKTDEIARYKQGKLVADLATLFIGTGEANSARKIITFEEYLGKSASNVEKAGAELLERSKGIEGLADNLVVGSGNDLLSFVNKTLAQKLEYIKSIWNTKYPVQEMLEGRSFFEDIMGQYRYTKSYGWEHTGDISDFFKGVDFYKGNAVGDQIFANTAVSMKTTITTNVDTWLASAPIQKNIRFLKDGLDFSKGLLSNGKKMVITNAEIHIYMPKVNITESLKTTWMNKLNIVDPKIKFEIKALEDFIQ